MYEHKATQKEFHRRNKHLIIVSEARHAKNLRVYETRHAGDTSNH